MSPELLLGLWRSKFFEKAAFYGGTALRILYGLDRFSEDLGFSLLEPLPDVDLAGYSAALEKELKAFGLDIRVEQKNKSVATAVQSAFLKADTVNQLLVIQVGADIARQISPGQVIRIKLEVDTDPPGVFTNESRYLLQPLPFSVRSYTLPDLFAGKMHALLCRRWKNRVKERDWYDLVWYCARYPQLHLAHLEQRMRQSGHWSAETPFTADALRAFLSILMALAFFLAIPHVHPQQPFPSGPGDKDRRDGDGGRFSRSAKMNGFTAFMTEGQKPDISSWWISSRHYLTQPTPDVIHCHTPRPGGTMLAIRLEKELEQELDLLAKAKGSNRSAVVREAIVRYLEDNEDLELARRALAETGSRTSLRQLRKELGLDS